MIRHLLIAAAMLSVTTSQLKAEDKAARAYLAGDMKRAASLLEQEIAKGDARTSRHLMLGRIYFNQSNWQKAETTLRTMLKNDPEHPQGNELLGRTLLHQKKYKESIPLYERSIRETGRTDLRLEYAEALMGTGERTDAIRILKKIISQKQSIPKAHFLLGKLRLESKTGRWASQQLWTAYKLGYKDKRLSQMLAESFLMEGRTTGPLKLIGPTTNAKPGDRTTEYIIVRAAGNDRPNFWYVSETDSAIYQSASSAEKNGTDNAHIIAARCWLTAGNTELAARHVSILKNKSKTYFLLSTEIAVQKENYPVIISLLAKMTKKVSRDEIRQLALDAAVAAQAQGKFTEALEILEQTEKNDPGRSDILRPTIDLLARLGKTEQAKQKAKLLWDLHPESPEAYLIAGKYKIETSNE